MCFCTHVLLVFVASVLDSSYGCDVDFYVVGMHGLIVSRVIFVKDGEPMGMHF